MRIKRFLGALALFVAILTVGSGAWALSYTNHVSLAPNGQGDVLIYPLYVATDGWESDISVINTSSTQSVVAKIVFRSYAYSQELMDFLIYLSPSDMWVGTIKRGVTDKYGKVGVGVYSVDSSALYDSGIDPATMPDPFARDEAGKRLEKLFITPIVAPGCAVDLNTMGYVTLLEAWSAKINFTAEELADKQKRGKRISADYLAAATTTPINALSGSIDISYPNGGAAATSAVALKDWQNMQKLFAGQTTALGKDLANNNQREMDAALSKGSISVPFDNNATVETWHAFTFPTKGTRITAVSPLCVLTNDSDYFRAAGQVGFAIDEYDIDEMHALNPFSPSKALTLPYEFYWVETGTAVFKQGWMQYRLPGSTTLLTDLNLSGQPLAYTGAPVIPLVLNFINDGSFPKMTIKNASYTDSTILGGAVGAVPTVPMPGYQYSSAYVSTK
jgi:hypothetical protein